MEAAFQNTEMNLMITGAWKYTYSLDWNLWNA